MYSVIAQAGDALSAADEAGKGLIILGCDSGADALRVVSTWPYRTNKSKATVKTADSKPYTEWPYTINMFIATALGTFIHMGEAFQWEKHGPNKNCTVGHLLEDMASDRMKNEHALLYFPDQAILGENAMEPRIRRQIILQILEICRQRREENGNCLVVIRSPNGLILPELRSEAYFIPVGYPSPEELSDIIHSACRLCGPGRTILSPTQTGELAEILRGARQDDVTDLFRMAFTQYENPTAGNAVELFDEAKKAKVQRILGVPGLYWIDPENVSLEGLHHLISWLKRHSLLFRHPYAAKRLLTRPPKGIVLCGLPGSGKTTAAKAAARIMGEDGHPLPLIQLSVSALMDRHYGQAEAYLETALQVINSVSPAVVILDEAEKLFGGVNDGQSHEVTQRLFSRLLQWLQDEKNSGVFVIVTANRMDRLPSEFVRKGRFDEIFFTGLPSSAECAEILGMYLKQKKRVIRLPEGVSFETLRDSVLSELIGTCAAKGRFMIASDMENLVESAFERLFYEHYEHLKDSSGVFLYDWDDVQNALLRELNETRSYFESNLSAAALYWLEMNERHLVNAGGMPEGDSASALWTVLPDQAGAFHPDTGEFDRNVLSDLGLLSTADKGDDYPSFLRQNLEAARKQKDYNACFRWTLASEIHRTLNRKK